MSYNQSMRVFIGIQPDGDAHRELESASAPLRRDFPDLRWVPAKNRHLTLKFLGEREPEEVTELRRTLSGTPLPVRDFALTIQGLGGFGGRDALRVLWAGVSTPPGLITLHDWLETQLERLGVRRDQRPFHPHITLARIDRPLNTASLHKRLDSCGNSVMATFAVSRFLVFRSRLTPDGPIYSILEETHLNHA